MKGQSVPITRTHVIYRWLKGTYLVFVAGLIVYYAITKDTYHLTTSAGSLLVPVGIALLWRLLRIQNIPEVSSIILIFLFIAWPLGACLDLYALLPGFDKVAHTLSGVFVSILALMLWLCLKNEPQARAEDAAMAAVFMFMTSMAVAGLWEIAEYLLSAPMGRDLQRVALTGVSDTMQDMLVCMLGTLLSLPFPLRLCRGQQDIVSTAIRSFADAFHTRKCTPETN